jgi:hypothetical protein
MAEGQKRIKALLASLERQGCGVERRTRGWFIKLPDGSSLVIHLTESDHRSEKNTRARVLRAGLDWPFDGRRKK